MIVFRDVSVSTNYYKVITHIKFILNLGFIRIILEVQETLQKFSFSATIVNHFLLKTTSQL